LFVIIFRVICIGYNYNKEQENKAETKENKNQTKDKFEAQQLFWPVLFSYRLMMNHISRKLRTGCNVFFMKWNTHFMQARSV